ncbi:MAG: hypothetical protein V8R52_03445 [Coprobacter fastidiosus]
MLASGGVLELKWGKNLTRNYLKRINLIYMRDTIAILSLTAALLTGGDLLFAKDKVVFNRDFSLQKDLCYRKKNRIGKKYV